MQHIRISVITGGGPLHWESKRQKITARSLAEAEIYATGECVKRLQQLCNILSDLDLISRFMPNATTVYNNNNVCMHWSKNMTTRGLCHIQIWGNTVREQYQLGNVNILHIAGAVNSADIFTKEDRDVAHYIVVQDSIQSKPLNLDRPKAASQSHATMGGSGVQN